MKNLLHVFLALWVFTAPASAHEFWLWPQPFSPAVGTRAVLTLHVGEHFTGEQVAFTTSHATAMRLYADGKVKDLRERIPGDAMLSDFRLVIAHAGTHLVAYDSAPSMLTLSPDKFHAYLHEEGLDAVIRQRENAKTADTPGRERFRRHVKTLLHGGGRSDASYALRTGQRLEIVSVSDSLVSAAGDTLGFRLWFDDKPLANALVKAWHKHDGQTLMIRARSGVDGGVRFTLPFAGPWMISVVHMVPASGEADLDWDSFWGNLTFELAARRR